MRSLLKVAREDDLAHVVSLRDLAARHGAKSAHALVSAHDQSHGHGSQPISWSVPIETGGLAALGGSVTVTIGIDGSVRWQGHAHDSGLDGYDFAISAVVRGSSGRTVALTHAGHVGGTLTSGAADHDWDVTQPANPALAARLHQFAGAALKTNLEYESDIGLEVGSLISTGSLVPGARVAEGILWMAGPANTLFAIAAEGIASAGSKTREITQEEYDWANAEVFDGALPARNKLVLTDTIGGGNRAFTFPRYDGKITLNMGPAAFADPRNYPGVPGRTYIHELVHACQIEHASMDVSLLADALSSKLCEATGGNPYAYAEAGPEYTTFNLEQQAQIVSDWFAGKGREATDQTKMPKDPDSPYFRYIVENVRIGRF
jgi:hypothetical protein